MANIVFAICWKYVAIVFVYNIHGRNAFMLNKKKKLTEWWMLGMVQLN